MGKIQEMSLRDNTFQRGEGKAFYSLEQLKTMQNCYISQEGGWKKVNGIERMLADALSVIDGVPFVTAAHSDMVVAATSIKTLRGSIPTIFIPQGSTDYGACASPFFAQMNDALYICDSIAGVARLSWGRIYGDSTTEFEVIQVATVWRIRHTGVGLAPRFYKNGLRAGDEITTTGFANAGNNATFVVGAVNDGTGVNDYFTIFSGGTPTAETKVNETVSLNPNELVLSYNLEYNHPATFWRMAVYAGRMWALDLNNRMMLYHSDYQNPEGWNIAGSAATDAGFFDFSYILPSGEEILSIIPYGEFLVVFFKNSIVICSGSTTSGASSDFAVADIISNVGLGKSRLAERVGNTIYFIDNYGFLKGVNQSTGIRDLETSSISSSIRDKIKAKIDVHAWGLGVQKMVYFNTYNWILFLIEDEIFVFDLNNNSWFTITGSGITSIFKGEIEFFPEMICCRDSKFCEFWTGYDWDGAANTIAMVWETNQIKIDNTYHNVNMVQIVFSESPTAGGTFGATVMVDQMAAKVGNYETALEDPLYSGAIVPIPVPFVAGYPTPDYATLELIEAYGRKMNIKIEETSILGPLQFNEFIIKSEKTEGYHGI
jgi:hypothetical protein